LIGNKSLHVFDVTTGKELKLYESDQFIDEYDVSHDAVLLAIAATDRASKGREQRASRSSVVRLLRKPLWQVDLPRNLAGEIRLSHDGQLLATRFYGASPVVNAKNWVRICSATSGEETHRIEYLQLNPQTLAFSPNGRVLAVSVEDSSVILLDLEQFRVK
jgi:hypothetical protein